MHANSMEYAVNKDPLSPNVMFVCTYMAKLSENLPTEVKTTLAFTKLIMDNLNEDIVAVNSNYGHASIDAFKSYIKSPKQRLSTKGRIRKVQGDGSCFNHCVESIIRIDREFAREKSLQEDKVYMVKCFPTTGTLQVPGAITEDVSDAPAILEKFLKYLNGLLKTNIGVINKEIKMINYKFRLVINSRPITDLGMIVRIREFMKYLLLIEKSARSEKDREIVYDKLGELGHKIILPTPFKIREIASDDVKTSFKLECMDSRPRITIFHSGKMSIVGGRDIDEIKMIYTYLKAVFQTCWDFFVVPLPKQDSIEFES